MNRKKYVMEQGAAVPFHNRTDYCVGTGRMGLALQKEYQEQLALVQEEIGESIMNMKMKTEKSMPNTVLPIWIW